MSNEQQASLKTLQDIKSIMEQSVRFISLSGWSGVWAGTIALIGCYIANNWLQSQQAILNIILWQFVVLAVMVFVIALAGGYYFTWRKTRQQGIKGWNSAAKKMVVQMFIPLATGGIFALYFLYNGLAMYVVPTCLTFYGLALINGSKYTLTDIQYLGLCEVAIGCICLFLPEYGLIFWALGFGALHIFYGTFMWNKYDKRLGKEEL